MDKVQNKKENISINLKSYISSFSNKDLNFIQKNLKNNQVSNRIYLIRHGITEKEENLKEGDLVQYSYDELSKNAIFDINEKLIPKLKEMGVRYNNSYLFYSKGAEKGKPVLRILETANIIKEKIGIDYCNIDENVDGLDTTDKNNLNLYNRQSKTGSMSSNFAIELEAKIKKVNLKNLNIICIIHKTNYSGIEGTLLDKNPKKIVIDSNQIEPLGIKYIDFNQIGEAINYTKESFLFFNDKNYKEILNILEKTGESYLDLITKINDYKNQNLQIWELQNYINAYFIQNPELFKKFLLASQEDLKIFCLLNLIKKGEFKFVTDYYLRITNEEFLSEREKEILISYIFKYEEIENLVTKLFLTKNKIWGEESKNLFEVNNLKDFYSTLKTKEIIYEKIQEIQSRSLDKDIKQGYGYIKRELFRVEKTYKNDEEFEYRYSLISENDLIDTKIVNKFILPSNVGNGKSIWITNLAKNILMKHDQDICFFEGRNFIVEKDLDKLNQDEKNLIFIDAIDEIKNEEIKKQVKNKLLKINNSTIITSRLSEYQENENFGFITLGFREIDIEDFLKEKIKDRAIRENTLYLIEKSHLSNKNDIQGNPLLLNFICILAVEKDKYKDIGIKNLDEIENKADLYENISRFVLDIYERNKTTKISTKNQVEQNMKRLGVFAYGLFYGKKTVEIIEENPDLLGGDELEEINLITKKPGSKEYSFIHNSFYEYFLARYLAIKDGGEQEIYEYKRKRLIGTMDSIKNYKYSRSFILFYYELLENIGKYDILMEFLPEELGLLSKEEITFASKRILQLNGFIE